MKLIFDRYQFLERFCSVRIKIINIQKNQMKLIFDRYQFLERFCSVIYSCK
jgi:hypothetical protein